MRFPLELPPPRLEGPDVVAFGECSIDIVGVLPGSLAPDGKSELADLLVLAGGQAATMAVGCARQGFRARFVGSIGDDSGGERIVAGLAAEGVDADVRVAEGVATRSAIILVDPRTGTRSVLAHRQRGLGRAYDPSLAAAALSGRILMVDATEAETAARLAEQARAGGIPTVVDIEAAGPGVEDLLRHIDIVIVTGGFAGRFAAGGSVSDGLRELARRFRPAIAVATLGADGSLAQCGGQEIRTPATPISVVDTIGAGDAFRAGFVSGWLAALPGPVEVERLLAWAAATAALNCRGRGAQAGLPTRREVEALV